MALADSDYTALLLAPGPPQVVALAISMTAVSEAWSQAECDPEITSRGFRHARAVETGRVGGAAS
jgi:hypothetical protein